ncbi:site-specific DNA-methyltransferase [Prevotella sp. P2-180]|uniref:DNA-methyltransferase n=1 Tax=Prevotella sp. P2-180 TaxID=2024224 RepID=UPI000B95E633|nr:site-specific DNA-methyltransferase [Prevotella sp. P2-180]OYP63242.1 site-specific DNA-methyltransferase [Prevotella sp. P2-180]
MEYQLDIHKDKAFYVSQRKDFTLIKGDSFSAMPDFDFKFDMIFADPPYCLSNGGISLQSGKVVCVDKGEILNVITWQKTNPPVNISCRFFTYSTEFVIWARKSKKVAHKFNYDVMKRLNDGKQMTDVWRLPAIGRWEKSCGKHPTQKPLALLTRIILACTDEGDWVFDPFSGSGTTGIAANLCKRRFCGIEREEEFCRMTMARREEIENLRIKADLKNHIADLRTLDSEPMQDLFACEPIPGGRPPFI